MTVRNIRFQSNEPREQLESIAVQKKIIIRGEGITDAKIKNIDIESNTITVELETIDYDDDYFNNEVLPFILFAFFKNQSGERFDVSLDCNNM